MLLRGYEIKQILPCIANPEWIRVKTELTDDISEVFPYLNAILKGAVYNPGGPTLTFHKETKMITLMPRAINMAQVPDEEDAKRTLKWLKELINDIWQRRSEITPVYERRELSARAIADRLPGTNCKECGLPTCFAFAMNVIRGRKRLRDCPLLAFPEHRERREVLEGILKAVGREELI